MRKCVSYLRKRTLLLPNSWNSGSGVDLATDPTPGIHACGDSGTCCCQDTASQEVSVTSVALECVCMVSV